MPRPAGVSRDIHPTNGYMYAAVRLYIVKKERK
jgi:hypothetical protein